MKHHPDPVIDNLIDRAMAKHIFTDPKEDIVDVIVAVEERTMERIQEELRELRKEIYQLREEMYRGYEVST